MDIQTGPAETTNYLIFGFSVIFGVILIHIASLRLRFKNAKDDLDAFEKSGAKLPRRKALPSTKRRK